MKILIVARRPTHPTNSGSRRFILNQVELFKRMGHDVYYLFIHEQPLTNRKIADTGSLSDMKAYWGDHLYVYSVNRITKLWYVLLLKYIRVFFRHGWQKVDDTYPYKLGSVVRNLDHKIHFDCCIVNYYELSKLFEQTSIPLKGITTHDYYSYKNVLLGVRFVRMSTDAHQEALALQRCPHIFALNTEEATFFKRLSPKSKIYNVFSVYDYRPSKIVGNKVLLFLSGSNPYNISGLNWFVNDIFPTIVYRIPDVVLRIGGAICNKIPELANHSNIEMVGYVDDMDKFYDSADVFINPTFEGTGLKIKTFEAISYDKVTMTHPHSKEGIFEPESTSFFSSKNADEWADFLLEIWSNDSGIKRIKNINATYIASMQNYVESEYRRFFSFI